MIINEVILNEKLSSMLYHSTKMSSLYNILKDDVFKLTPDIGTHSEIEHRTKKEKLYYMSFARSKFGSYNRGHAYKPLLLIDGDKLNQNFYGKAIDYWSSFPDDKRSEMEDRLFHDKPYIKNASKYIKEIHLLVKDKWDTDIPNDYVRMIIQLKIQAKKRNIPFYLYEDSKSFSMLDKDNTISVDTLPDPEKPKSDPFRRFYNRRKPKHFDEIFELLNKNEYDKLSNNAKDKLDKLSGFYKNETIRNLKLDIHNTKDNPRHKDIIYRLINEMKKRKLYSVEELAKHLVDKFDSA